MKLLLKILQEGIKAYDKDTKTTLSNYSKKIIEREKHKELDDLLEGLFPVNVNLNETKSNLSEIKKKPIYPDINIFLVFNNSEKTIFIIYEFKLENDQVFRTVSCGKAIYSENRG